MTNQYRERIIQIASEYHSAGTSPDMFIENCIQRFEIDWLRNFAPQGSRLLELGVGDGVTMKGLSPAYDYEVVEGAQSLAEYARRYSIETGIKFKVHQEWFEEFRPEAPYDFVYASHVLEHVLEPLPLLRRMRSWLRTSGKLIIVVPNASSIHRRLGVELGLQPELASLSNRDREVGHLRVYSLEDLLGQLTEAGYFVELHRGFFVKSLANSQLLHLTDDHIWGLCKISDDLPAEMCANLCVVASLGRASVQTQ